jgi:hypothetical protein
MGLTAVVNWATSVRKCVKILEHLNQIGGPGSLWKEMNESSGISHQRGINF